MNSFSPFEPSNYLSDRQDVSANVSIYNLMDYCYMGLVNKTDQEYVASIGSVRRPSVDMCIINQYYCKKSVSDDDLKSNRFRPTDVDSITASLLKKREMKTVHSLLERLFLQHERSGTNFIEEEQLPPSVGTEYGIPYLCKNYMEYCKDNNLVIRIGETLKVLHPTVPITSCYAYNQPLCVHIYRGILQSHYPHHSNKSVFDVETSEEWCKARQECIYEILTQRAVGGIKQLLGSVNGRELLTNQPPLQWNDMVHTSNNTLCDYNILGKFIYDRLNENREIILEENKHFDWLEVQLERTTKIFDLMKDVVRLHTPREMGPPSVCPSSPMIGTSRPSTPITNLSSVFRRSSLKSIDNVLFPYYYKPISPCKDIFTMQNSTTTQPIGCKSSNVEQNFSDQAIKDICCLIYPKLSNYFQSTPLTSSTLYMNFINYRQKYLRTKYNTLILIVLCSLLSTTYSLDDMIKNERIQETIQLDGQSINLPSSVVQLLL